MRKFPIHLVCVYGIVENKKDEILLLKSRDKNSWMFPGGQVESGENLLDAMIRETKEESNMDVAVDKLYCIASNTCSYPGHSGYGMILGIYQQTRIFIESRAVYITINSRVKVLSMGKFD